MYYEDDALIALLETLEKVEPEKRSLIVRELQGMRLRMRLLLPCGPFRR